MKNFIHSSSFFVLKITFILFWISVSAQNPPQKISFQAVVRNSSNTLISNTAVGMRISILQGTVSGTVVYREIFSPNPTTNINGLVTVEVGAGIPQVGAFSEINWANGPYFIKTETDPVGGTNYTISGTTQLLSVPYALYAAQAGNAGWGLTGTAGTNPTSNFIGTTDNQDVIFKRNGVFAGKIATSNTYFGHYYTYNATTTGQNNAAFGAAALAFNATGSSNTALGADALFNNVDGMENTATGVAALAFNTLGNYNTAMGRDALRSNKANSRSTAMGYGSMYFADDRVVGRETYNTAIGYQALVGSSTPSNNTGQGNTALGDQALFSNSSGASNNAMGMSALKYNTTGANNTAVGLASLMYNTTGVNNVAIGHWAMYYNKGNSRSTAVGFEAMRNADDRVVGRETYNTAIGYQALLGSFTVSNNTGQYNTALGDQALYANTTGNNNTAIGQGALTTNTAGTSNTGVGRFAYFSGVLDNTTCIGYVSGGIVNASNRIEIGNSSVSVIAGQVGWSTYSDERIKDNISEDVPGLDFITKLRPVTYNLNIHRQNAMMKDLNKVDTDWKEKYAIEEIKMSGFLAQEVEDAARASGYDFSGVQAPVNPNELYSIRYSDFVMPLVKAVQEQQVIIEQQNATIEQLIKRIEALENK